MGVGRDVFDHLCCLIEIIYCDYFHMTNANSNNEHGLKLLGIDLRENAFKLHKSCYQSVRNSRSCQTYKQTRKQAPFSPG